MFMKVHALAGDRGIRFDYGGLKIDLLPPSKATSQLLKPRVAGGGAHLPPAAAAALFH